MAGTKRTLKFTLMLIAFLLSGCRKSGADSVAQQRAASILLDQFETVFYAKPDLLSSSGGYQRLSQQDANALRVPFANLLQGLDPLEKQSSAEILGNANAVLVGAKDFRAPGGPPPNLGGVQSRFCYVLVLGSRSTFAISKVVSKSGVISPADNGVWKWSAPPTEGHSQPYTFYATQVASSYLLISNSLDDIHAISTNLTRESVPNTSGFPGWESISQHEVWGYRRYRHTEEDKEAAGTSQVTPDTKALAFFADPKQKTGVLRLFSPTGGTAGKINGTGILSPFKPISKGVWETRIPLTGDQKTFQQMFAAMSWFGFGVLA